ncbi:MAG: hypothetical protein K7J46_16320 [Bryobacter sp.]|jgi:hypothetical protein|nr:hypothetical protein [Bryobacter sp. CoA8 C33]
MYVFVPVLLAASLLAQTEARPGRFVVEHPTLHNLGFEWKIEGDANRNARVGVRYRAAGETAWKTAQPLLRIGGERPHRERESMTYTVPHGFAGSIFGLKPGTAYECEFTMADPDGVSGSAVERVRVATRTEPRPYRGGRVLHVYPADHVGPKIEPSYIGLKAAYYGEGRGDWTAVRMTKAQPGDTILVHAGLYRPERYNYVDPLSAPFTGSWSLSLKGTAERPITIQGAGDGEAIFDGGGNARLFDMMASAHHIIEGLTFRNTEIAIFAGEKEVLGASHLTVRQCRFEDVGTGVWTESADSRDFLISDNLFLGREDQMRLIGWNQAGQRTAGIYPSHQLRSFFAVKVYGPGHVIAHNAVAYFHDGICISTYGPPEADPERQASSIDIYNNDIHLSNDDFIEADGGVHNIRVYHNRGVNAAHNGYSAQPVFGGPVYFLRNLAYQIPAGGALKFNASPAGIIAYHNTFIAEQAAGEPYYNAHFRNNLFLGRDTPNKGIMVWAHASSDFSSDYNGFRPNRGVKEQYTWQGPGAAKQSFATLEEVRRATGAESHGIELDYDIFEKLGAPDANRRYQVYHSPDLNFGLRAGGRAVDAAEPLVNINDGFSGKAPDLGALELGQPLPHYGPRWITWAPFYR